MDLTSPKAKLALHTAEKIRDAGHTVYFAGGCVRDALMSRTPEDYDLATSAEPDQVEALFEKTVAVGKQFGVILVVYPEHSFEVTTFRKEGVYKDGRHPSSVSFTDAEEDASRRDFTVNGLFYDPFEKKVIDFVGGREDIGRKVIRAIGDPRQRFTEDKLRLLRAVRFASTLGFELEKPTWEAVKDMAGEIRCVSPERIRDELVKMLIRSGASRGLDLLSDSGLLKVILPEVEAMKGVAQQPEYHPEGDVFVHTKLLLDKLDRPDPVLALGALFHDIGKPVTYQVRNGKITFYEHAHIGAKMTQEVMKRLRFSNQEIQEVAECVAFHMTFADVQKMRSGKLKRFISRPTFDVELELHRIDCLSCHCMMDNYHFLQDKVKEYAAEDLKPKPLINGNDLIALGMKPGPKMKPLLEEVYELQLENQFSSKDDALEWVRQNIEKSP